MDKQNRSGSSLLVVVLWCVLSLAAQIAAAEGTFACHVVTERGDSDVYFVQTGDGNTARKHAMGAGLATGGRETAQVTEVVECINFPNGRFSSSAMQAYIEKMPR